MTRYSKHLLLALLVALPATAVAPSVGHAQGIGLDEHERMLIPTRWRLQNGAEVYSNQCAGCHGKNGKGIEGLSTEQYDNPIPDLTDQSYRYGGSPTEIYNVITNGPTDAYHPTYDRALRYQQRWAVSHLLHAWSVYGENPSGSSDGSNNYEGAARAASVGGPEAPADVREQARTEAEKGRCKPEVMASIEERIGSQLEPKGKDQIEKGRNLYQQSGCTGCHGAEGKVASGMENINIPPRNFRSKNAEWYNGANPLAIFNTLTNGARGQMRGYEDQLSPEERWAIAHFLLETWVPKEIQTEVGDEQLRNLCRQESAPPPPEAMWDWGDFDNNEQAIRFAMTRLAEDAAERRVVKLRQYGPVRLTEGADAEHGKRVYTRQCASCHGGGAQGNTLGPFGIERVLRSDQPLPRLRIDVRPLRAAHAGGTFRDFAVRSTSGVHATLPNMTGPSLLKAKDWQDLQAYIATLGASEQSPSELSRDDYEGPVRPPAVERVPRSRSGAERPGETSAPDAGATGAAAPDAGTSGRSGTTPASNRSDAN